MQYIRSNSFVVLFLGPSSYMNIYSLNLKCLLPNGTDPDTLPSPPTSPSPLQTTSTPKQTCTEANPLPGLARCDPVTGVWSADTTASNQTQTNGTVLSIKSITLLVNGSLSTGGGLIVDGQTQLNVTGKEF